MKMKNLYKFEDFINEANDTDITKLSDDMLKEIVKVFNGVKHKLPSNDLALLAKLTVEIKKRGLKESVTESTVNEGVASLDSYYKNAEKSVRDSAKKIDAILNKEIKSDATKKELLDLITDMVEEYAVEYADNRDQERY
jgi:hypothetical protein